jgi:hypothetical protein
MKDPTRYTICGAIVLLAAASVTSLVWNKTPVRNEVPAPVVNVDPTIQVKVSATLVATNPGEYKLSVKALIPKGLHIYSITQVGKETRPTVIDLDPSSSSTMQSSWSESPITRVVRYDFMPDIDLKFLEGTAEWTTDIRAFDPQVTPVISGTITVGPCGDTGCLMPQKIRFTTN